jgi:hypothetical protein
MNRKGKLNIPYLFNLSLHLFLNNFFISNALTKDCCTIFLACCQLEQLCVVEKTVHHIYINITHQLCDVHTAVR